MIDQGDAIELWKQVLEKYNDPQEPAFYEPMDIVVMALLVNRYLEGDIKRTIDWFVVPNPELGNVTPEMMIRIGNCRKLLNWIIERTGGVDYDPWEAES